MTEHDPAHIRRLEELGLNAWPSLRTLCCNGWLLRTALGYTRRANSVQPLYPPSGAVDETIWDCERFYTAQGLPTIFKITPAALPADLDAILERHDYAREAETSVHTLSLENVSAALHNTRLTLSTVLSQQWLDAFCTLNAISLANSVALRAMLGNLSLPACFAAIEQDGRTAAVGMAVFERGYVGLFDIVTASDLRNRGLGRQVVSGLLQWGADNGASTAYLQVVQTNLPAVHLYEKLGFRAAYTYWYRVQTLP